MLLEYKAKKKSTFLDEKILKQFLVYYALAICIMRSKKLMLTNKKKFK